MGISRAFAGIVRAGRARVAGAEAGARDALSALADDLASAGSAAGADDVAVGHGVAVDAAPAGFEATLGIAAVPATREGTGTGARARAAEFAERSVARRRPRARVVRGAIDVAGGHRGAIDA